MRRKMNSVCLSISKTVNITRVSLTIYSAYSLIHHNHRAIYSLTMSDIHTWGGAHNRCGLLGIHYRGVQSEGGAVDWGSII